VTTTSAAEAEPLDGSSEGPVRIRGALLRLLLWIAPAYFAIFLLWGALPGVLLSLQIAGLDPDPEHKVANLTVVATVGAIGAMIAQPVAGLLSDRSRTRFGRRAPWMVGGATAGGLALLVLGQQTSLLGIALSWLGVQLAYNFVQGPLSAILPDRVPRAVRGTFAATTGLGIMVGVGLGPAVASWFSAAIPTGYAVLAVFVLLVVLAFVLFNRERSSLGQPAQPFRLWDFLGTFWVNPIAHPDFFWAFTGRLLLYLGYFGVTTFLLYLLADYIGLGEAEASSVAGLLGLFGLPFTITAIVVSGPLSDLLGRRKVFVFGSSVLIGLALIVPLALPTVTGMFIMAAALAFGFGMFQSIDTALMTEVLPNKEAFGKDLGVVNIAATLPQTLAPAIGGLIILTFGGYIALFPAGILFSVLGALAVWPIRSVR